MKEIEGRKEGRSSGKGILLYRHTYIYIYIYIYICIYVYICMLCVFVCARAVHCQINTLPLAK
jgi:hypothetical protein